jgi:ribonuclease J
VQKRAAAEDGSSDADGVGGAGDELLQLRAVGGFRQVGMNCVALEQESQRVLIDCGVTFAPEESGVEAYRPSFDDLLGDDLPLSGVVLTHGHEDHIGAVPELLLRCNAPVWGRPYALALLRRRLAEHVADLSSFDLRPIEPRSPFGVGPFSFEAIQVAHSTPEACAFAVQTAVGTLVHSGDFKIDPSLPAAERTDEGRLAELGRAGVRVLLSDSTNSSASGCSGSEQTVVDSLDGIIRGASGRALVALFASNVHRLRALGGLAQRHGRRLCLLGRSMGKHVEVATVLGHLDWPTDLLTSAAEAARSEPSQVLYAATGAQGERRGALARVAAGSFPGVRLEPGDVAVLSSRVIPGQELAVQATIDRLLRGGVRVHTRRTDPQVHVSGHAHRDELSRLLELCQPRLLVPVHGGREQLDRHAELARAAGVPEIELLDEGDGLRIERRATTRLTDGQASPPVAMAHGRPVPDEVLRERQQLGRSGAVCLTLGPATAGDSAADRSASPSVAMFALGVAADPELVRRVEAAVAGALCQAPASALRSQDAIERIARETVRQELRRAGAGRPTIFVRHAPPERTPAG